MIQKSKGILIVLSGFSGSGKGTIMKELMKKYSDQYALSISATTRSPRPGETDGVEYFFRTKEQFEKMIADDINSVSGSLKSEREVPRHTVNVCHTAKRRGVKEPSGWKRNRGDECHRIKTFQSS
mgnify:CR=1 FL=1